MFNDMITGIDCRSSDAANQSSQVCSSSPRRRVLSEHGKLSTPHTTPPWAQTYRLSAPKLFVNPQTGTHKASTRLSHHIAKANTVITPHTSSQHPAPPIAYLLLRWRTTRRLRMERRMSRQYPLLSNRSAAPCRLQAAQRRRPHSR